MADDIYRPREHFFGLMYEFFVRTRAVGMSEESHKETAGLAYAFHNLPSALAEPDWTPQLSKIAWNMMIGSSTALGGAEWLTETDERLRAEAKLGYEPVPKWGGPK